MGSQEIIRVENISKKYKLGVYSASTLRDDVASWMARVRKRSNPNLTVGSENRVTDNGEFWALRNISFSVSQGEILGIVGRNGAGKSTLLKILSRITHPNSGTIKIKGRVGSLLEVGTGFHPELTGMENIFLNGAILGMSKQEINAKLEEIIEFSGVKDHIGTPVKRYSSGMKVRLGFAVAAHLEPEVLIIDEVLAVGDAEFQKKCIGKMKEVSNSGRTILFVSHNMTAVRTLCTKSLILNEGKLSFMGATEEVIGRYLGGDYSNRSDIKWENGETKNEDIEITRVLVRKPGNSDEQPITMKDDFYVEIEYERFTLDKRIDFTLQFKGISGEVLFTSGSGSLSNNKSVIGKNRAAVKLPGNFFNSGVIEVNLLVVKNRREVIFNFDSLLSFTVVDAARNEGQWLGRSKGDLAPALDWEILN